MFFNRIPWFRRQRPPVAAKTPTYEEDMPSFIKNGFAVIKDTRTFARDASLMEQWREISPYFDPWELDSDDFSMKVDMRFVRMANDVREEYGKAIRFTNVYRNPKHNARVGGKPNSRHLYGDAGDVIVPSYTAAKRLEKLFIKHGATAIGRYPVSRFMHVDMRPPKPSGKLYRWGPNSWDKMKSTQYSGGGSW